LLCAASAAWAGSPAPDQPFRAPYLPAADGEVLQRVPAPADPKVAAMRTLRRQLDADPRNLTVALRLADAYVDFGRQVGDAHYAGYAEAVIAPWLAQQPPPVETLVVQATILQYRHQFDAARALLKEAVRRDAKNGQAWLILATLDSVQGDYTSASHGCAQVAGTAGYTYAAACAAALRANLGQAQQSVAMLDLIVQQSAGQPPALEAWIEGLGAESAERLGDWTSAEQHYRKALALTPDDNFLQVAYADFLLDRGRPAEVLKLLGTDSASDTAFLRIALAQAALGSPDLARYVWVMSARFAGLQQRGSDFFGREQARFALQLQHDPEGALQIAAQNWNVQREPPDTRVLLEAALAAKRPAAAASAIAFVERSKLQDPIIRPLVEKLRAMAPAASGAAR
jgi:tetratricopeptide (TPR) repeat protein